MLGELEDLAAIGPLAFEYRAGVVQSVGQDVHLGIAPGDECPIHPDQPVAIVIRNEVGHASLCPSLVFIVGEFGVPVYVART